jgi:hypothetical protein
MQKYNYSVTASFINDKTRKFHTMWEHVKHYKVGVYDLMHDNNEGALYLKTSKVGLLVSFVSRASFERHLDNGTVNEQFITDYLTKTLTKPYPARAEAARQEALTYKSGK